MIALQTCSQPLLSHERVERDGLAMSAFDDWEVGFECERVTKPIVEDAHWTLRDESRSPESLNQSDHAPTTPPRAATITHSLTCKLQRLISECEDTSLDTDSDSFDHDGTLEALSWSHSTPPLRLAARD